MVQESYLKKIEQKILTYSKKIKEIRDLTSVKNFYYTDANLKSVEEVLRDKDIDKVAQMNDSQNSPMTKYLIIKKFLDQENKPYAVTIYDDEELWNEARIIAIYPLT